MKKAEEQLIARARRGSRAAFGELVRIYRDRVLALAYDLTGNYTDAQDVAQEAFIKAYRGLIRYQGKSAFYTWLYRITVNQARDLLRKRKEMVSVDSPGITAAISSEDVFSSAENRLDNQVLQKAVEEALSGLSENQRTAVILTYFHGLSSAEAGEVMTISANTVRTHMLRALSKLKPMLNDIKELMKL